MTDEVHVMHHGSDEPVLTVDRYTGKPFVRVSGVALILRGPLLLLLKRTDDGCWGPPGGKQNFGEPIGYTAVRETHEETGLVVGAGPVVGVIDWYSEEQGKHFTVWFLGCRYINDPQQAEARVLEPDKATEVRWVHLDMLGSLPLTDPFVRLREQYPDWAERVPQL